MTTVSEQWTDKGHGVGAGQGTTVGMGNGTNGATSLLKGCANTEPGNCGEYKSVSIRGKTEIHAVIM